MDSCLYCCTGWRWSFRFYSAATVLLLVVPAAFGFSYVTAVAATQPTPGMGLAERIAQYGYQLWQAALAVVLSEMREIRLSQRRLVDARVLDFLKKQIAASRSAAWRRGGVRDALLRGQTAADATASVLKAAKMAR